MILLTLDGLLEAHDALVIEHGGASVAVRDLNALASVLARPQNHLAYVDPDASPYTLAALYGHGLARAHAFVDGNKRVAWLAMCVFLALQDIGLEADETDICLLMADVATGATDEVALGLWLAAHAGGQGG